MRKWFKCANPAQRLICRVFEDLSNLSRLFPPAAFIIQATAEMDNDRNHIIDEFLFIIWLDTVYNNQVRPKRGGDSLDQVHPESGEAILEFDDDCFDCMCLTMFKKTQQAFPFEIHATGDIFINLFNDKSMAPAYASSRSRCRFKLARWIVVEPRQ